FFFSSRRRHTRSDRDWSSDVCSSDLVGKVNVDKHIFKKASALERIEFEEMADHTVMGHSIVAGVEFPWPQIPEVVRSHHERADRSEERRVGKECRARGWPKHNKRNAE